MGLFGEQYGGEYVLCIISHWALLMGKMYCHSSKEKNQGSLQKGALGSSFVVKRYTNIHLLGSALKYR